MWDYLVKKVRPGNASRPSRSAAAPRAPGEAESVQPTDKHPAAEAAGERPRRLLCPACSGAMRVEKVGGVEIDRCGACGGIFLDRGELEELTHEKLPPASSAGRTPADRGAVLIYTPTGLR